MELQISPLSVIISLIILSLFLFKLLKRSKPNNLPPGPTKLPIIGNLLQLARVDPIPHRGLLELAQKYGPLMHLQLGKISAIVVSTPRVAKEVLKTHDLSCADRPDMLLGRIMLKNSRDIVLAPYGDYWRQMRKISTSELLSANKVRSFRNIREEESWQLVESVRSSLGSPVNFSTQVTGMANAVICRAAIGKKCAYQDELIEVVEDIAYWGSGFFMADLFPSLKFLEYVTGMRPKLQKMRRKLDHIFENIIQEHMEKMASKKEGKVNENEEEDLIDVLLRIKESQSLDIPITSKDIQGITLDMFTAGTDSTSATLQWMMSELMRNPEAMKKAQAEVREVLKGKTKIYEADVQGLTYLKLVIKETLRLHAPVPLLVPRECRKQCEIDGYTIPVGTKIMVNAWAIANELILRSSGTVNVDGSNNFVSVFSKRGNKGVNQDCCIVWEEFGCQDDMMFCGIFDGHGLWGHFVAKTVRESLPLSLLCNWQEALVDASLDPDIDLESDKRLQIFNLWKHSYLKACASVDRELEQHRRIDSFHSGTTALTVVRQGELLVVANVGDSRAVLGTTSDDGSLIPVQLTLDFKPNIPQEAERIVQCKGRVFCLDDEPGVHRVWLPNEESPGLAMSRAFGDYCVKDFGLISVPEVTQRQITARDQFIVLATDGVWDVVSNQEAVAIVSSTPDRAKSAKRLVECAVRAWKRKRRNIAADDISAICLFFHTSQISHQIHPIATPKLY